MEYISRCPNCKQHNIMETVKKLNANGKHPQKQLKCAKCKETTRQTIIGEIERVPDYSISAQPEYATHNRLLIKFW